MGAMANKSGYDALQAWPWSTLVNSREEGGGAPRDRAGRSGATS